MLSSYLDAIFFDDKDFTLLISPCTCKSPQALSRVLLSASQCFLRSKRSGTLHVPKKLIPPASVMQNIMFGQKKKKKKLTDVLLTLFYGLEVGTESKLRTPKSPAHSTA